MFTLINAIYRKEKLSIEKTLMSMNDRYYDVYIAYVALLVRLIDFGLDSTLVNYIKADISKHVKYDLDQLVIKKTVNIRELSRIDRHPAIDSV